MNRKRGIRIAIEIALLIALIVIFVLSNEQIIQNRKSTFEFVDDSNGYAYQVEKISDIGEYIEFSGWFFELKNVRNVNKTVNDDTTLGIVLYDLNSENSEKNNAVHQKHKGLLCEVNCCIRNDINEYFSCEYDYSKCGFVARIKKSYVDLDNGIYQIVFKPDDEGNYGINAGAYICNGVIQYINPRDVLLLDVNNTDIETIVTNGYCVVSYPESEICAYQYKKKLYWIVDISRGYNKEIMIQLFNDTTQFDSLPKERIVNGWYWDNVSSKFTINEITEKMDCGHYRVCEMSITDKYPITMMTTKVVYEGTEFENKIIRPLFLYKNE